ncbi:CS domain, partial [Dillenia turbinata]
MDLETLITGRPVCRFNLCIPNSQAFSEVGRHPSVKWAQRSDKVFLTIDLPDAKDVKLKLEPEGKFFFSATTGPEKIPYEIDFDLFDKVDVNESKVSIGLRNICYLVKKAEEKWWSRLLKQEGKPPVFLKVDWDKWADEDEEPEETSGAKMDFGDIDFSKLNMGGGGDFDYGGADQDEDDDSDTEEESNAEEEAPSAD